MKPWMSKEDISKIEALLLNRNKPHLSILEWGSGGSTLHFTSFLSRKGITYDWLSIEYNKKWAEKIKKKNINNTKIVLFDVGNDDLKQRYTDMDEYVNYPLLMNKLFDFILVDGRKRRRCLINASKLLFPNGVVTLHDAQRKYYHCAFSNYSYSKFLTKTLWVGKNG